MLKLIDLEEKIFLKNLVSWIEVQLKRRTRSLGSKTGFNLGKGHSNLGKISSHRGSSKFKERDITIFIYKEKQKKCGKGQDAHKTYKFILLWLGASEGPVALIFCLK